MARLFDRGPTGSAPMNALTSAPRTELSSGHETRQEAAVMRHLLLALALVLSCTTAALAQDDEAAGAAPRDDRVVSEEQRREAAAERRPPFGRDSRRCRRVVSAARPLGHDDVRAAAAARHRARGTGISAQRAAGARAGRREEDSA